jgi:hypothetical protein
VMVVMVVVMVVVVVGGGDSIVKIETSFSVCFLETCARAAQNIDVRRAVATTMHCT